MRRGHRVSFLPRITRIQTACCLTRVLHRPHAAQAPLQVSERASSWGRRARVPQALSAASRSCGFLRGLSAVRHAHRLPTERTSLHTGADTSGMMLACPRCRLDAVLFAPGSRVAVEALADSVPVKCLITKRTKAVVIG